MCGASSARWDDDRVSRLAGHADKDVPGREPKDGETFAVLPRSEWQLSLKH
jgi:hypothetical protein